MKSNITPLFIWCFLIVSSFFGSCNHRHADDSPIPPAVPPASKVTITALVPSHGVSAIRDTITGSNFSTNATENIVTYNGIQATVLSATTTQIVVIVPEDAGTGYVTIKLNN